jgi:2-dehydro-3-deoxygluconokinase
MGTYFLDQGGDPRGTDVIYDRADSAVTTATADELPLGALDSTDLFYTSGITPALSRTLAETTGTLLERASEAGVTTAFDLNYRSKLWPEADARRAYESLLPHVDVLFAAERDVRSILGFDLDTVPMVNRLATEYGLTTTVVTRGEHGAVALHGDEVHDQGVYEAETVDPVGSGDAFVGGFLARRVNGGTVREALAYGSATASLKRTIEGDLAVVTPAEVQAVIDEDGGGISR